MKNQNQERDHEGSDYMIVSRRLVDGVFGMHNGRCGAAPSYAPAAPFDRAL
jgi:hypothetical protein